MPLGYEKIRDALMRKGKSESEAKSMAAAIWNKNHKDDPVTNKEHDKKDEKHMEVLHQFGLAMHCGPSGMLTPGLKKKLVKGRAVKAALEHTQSLWPTNRPQFNLESHCGVVLLGLPSDFAKAEEVLAKKLGRKVPNLFQPQVRAPLPMPVKKYPGPPGAPKKPGPSLKEILEKLTRDRSGYPG